jgi:hypothetical protein
MRSKSGIKNLISVFLNSNSKLPMFNIDVTYQIYDSKRCSSDTVKFIMENLTSIYRADGAASGWANSWLGLKSLPK